MSIDYYHYWSYNYDNDFDDYNEHAEDHED